MQSLVCLVQLSIREEMSVSELHYKSDFVHKFHPLKTHRRAIIHSLFKKSLVQLSVSKASGLD